MRQEQPFRKLSGAKLLNFTQSIIDGPLFSPCAKPYFFFERSKLSFYSSRPIKNEHLDTGHTKVIKTLLPTTRCNTITVFLQRLLEDFSSVREIVEWTSKWPPYWSPSWI